MGNPDENTIASAAEQRSFTLAPRVTEADPQTLAESGAVVRAALGNVLSYAFEIEHPETTSDAELGLDAFLMVLRMDIHTHAGEHVLTQRIVLSTASMQSLFDNLNNSAAMLRQQRAEERARRKAAPRRDAAGLAQARSFIAALASVRRGYTAEMRARAAGGQPIEEEGV